MEDLKNKLRYIIKNIGVEFDNRISIGRNSLVLGSMTKKEIDKMIDYYNRNEYIGGSNVETKNIKSFLNRLSYVSELSYVDIKKKNLVDDYFKLVFNSHRDYLSERFSEYYQYIKSDSFKDSFFVYLSKENNDLITDDFKKLFEKNKMNILEVYGGYNLSLGKDFNSNELVEYNSKKMLKSLKFKYKDLKVIDIENKDINYTVNTLQNENSVSNSVVSRVGRMVPKRQSNTVRTLAEEVLDEIYKENDIGNLSVKVFNKGIEDLNDIEKRYVEYLDKIFTGIKDKTLDFIISITKKYSVNKNIDLERVVKSEKGIKNFKELIYGITGYIGSGKGGSKPPIRMYSVSRGDFFFFVKSSDLFSHETLNRGIDNIVVELINSTRLKDLNFQEIFDRPSVILYNVGAKEVNFLIEESLNYNKYIERAINSKLKDDINNEKKLVKSKAFLKKVKTDLPQLKLSEERKNEIHDLIKNDSKDIEQDLSYKLYLMRGILTKELLLKYIYQVYGKEYGINEFLNMDKTLSDEELKELENRRKLNNISNQLDEKDIKRMEKMRDLLINLNVGKGESIYNDYKELKLDIKISNDNTKCMITDNENKYIFNPVYFIKIDKGNSKKLLYKRIHNGSTIKPMLEFIKNGIDLELLDIESRKFIYKIIEETWYLR